MSDLTGRTFASLQIRNFRLYLASQLVSFSGTWMQSLAQSWLVLELTGSGTALGTVLAFQFLPTLLLAPIGGVIADRSDKRRLLMATQSAAMMVALLLGLLTLSGVVELWMVYVVAGAFGVITAIDHPARQTFVGEMVGPAHLTNAVMLNSVMINVARALGPAFGGILISTLGIAQCFLVNAGSYIFVISALAILRTDEIFPSARADRAPGQLRQGLSYAWHTPTLRSTLLILSVIGMFTFELAVTLPLLADHTFDVGSSGLAIMETLFGIGAVFGGLAVAASGVPGVRARNILAAVGGVCTLVLAIAPNVFLAYAAIPFLGASLISLTVVCNATIQLNSAPHLRGRVMALFSMAVIGTTPIGGPIVGWVGEHVDPRAAVGMGAAAALLAAAYGWFETARTSAGAPVDAPVELLAATPAAGN